MYYSPGKPHSANRCTGKFIINRDSEPRNFPFTEPVISSLLIVSAREAIRVAFLRMNCAYYSVKLHVTDEMEWHPLRVPGSRSSSEP
jgi:hypothetical protein